MRCTNCGWENSPERTRCEKCNIPLEQNNDLNENQKQSEHEIFGTIKGTPPLDPFVDEQKPVQVAQNLKEEENNLNLCLECGYPNRPDSERCPQCGYYFNRQEAQNVQAKKSGNLSGTIDPYTQINFVSCKLKPIPRNNEPQPASIEFSGETIDLNRTNLEPANKAITSNTQATIELIDGKWHIIDKSSMGNTFVRAIRHTELQNGDIILLGDRKFIFEG